jgi:protein farnesyltransferase subunit beta
MHQESFCPWNPFHALLPLRVLNFDTTPEFPAIQQRLTQYYAHHRSNGLFSGFQTDYLQVVTAYAGVSGIALIGTDEAYELIDRQAAYRAIMECKLPNGAFMTGVGMEWDIRATFSAILIASLLNILTPELIANSAEFVLSCVNYDGGIAPRPGMEAHGGYVHCGVGIMKILGRLDDLNLPRLIRWIATRQVEFSGGFCGRAHKLVDGCYTWWIGAAARMISNHLGIPPFWNEGGIADFMLRICQDLRGGFASRPPSAPDAFHTLYGLAGLCVCGGGETGNAAVKLREVDDLVACPKELVERMREYFRQRLFTPE